MNKQEIQALIDSKIAGQGSAVDVGGALPKILHEILEAAFAGENVQSNWDEADSQSPQYIQNKPSIPAPYTLPTASAETLGGVKVGSGLSMNEGVLSAEGGGGVSFPIIKSDEEWGFVDSDDKLQCKEALNANKVVYLTNSNDVFIVVSLKEGSIHFYDGVTFRTIYVG